MTAVEVLVNHLVVYSFVGVLAWAAYSDFRQYLIPNRLSLAIVALYPAYVLSAPVAVDWVMALVIAEIVFVIGLAMFALRLTGGGDIKLLTAVSLWAGPDMILSYVFITAMCGGVLSLAVLMRTMPLRLWAATPVRVSLARVKVPYGVAIAAGGLFLAGQFLSHLSS